jgi:murein DD-endopeptidase MepM/ murein hydrolase activator NlpD
MNLDVFVEQTMTLDVDEIEDIELVKDIQRHLNRIGYSLTVDGVSGAKTCEAWARFKKSRYLSDPDKIGSESAKLLLLAPTIAKRYFLPTEGIGWISSPYGPRSLGFHKGVDIACNEGTAIYAVAEGIITTAISGCEVGNYRCGGGYGNVIYIEHQGLPFSQTRYAHLARLAAGIRIGNSVKKGALIGYCGNTGHSFGPHLHFETRVAGYAKNPIDFINPLI